MAGRREVMEVGSIDKSETERVFLFYRPHMVEKCQGWDICRNSKNLSRRRCLPSLGIWLKLQNENEPSGIAIRNARLFSDRRLPVSLNYLAKDQMVKYRLNIELYSVRK